MCQSGCASEGVRQEMEAQFEVVGHALMEVDGIHPPQTPWHLAAGFFVPLGFCPACTEAVFTSNSLPFRFL